MLKRLATIVAAAAMAASPIAAQAQTGSVSRASPVLEQSNGQEQLSEGTLIIAFIVFVAIGTGIYLATNEDEGVSP